MKLEIQHVEVHVSDIEKAREFYVRQLGLEVLKEIPTLHLLALKAGGVRISIFGGYEPNEAPFAKKASTHIIFRTDDLDATIHELESRGVVFIGQVFEAPGFIRDISTLDPDGNVVEIAEYLRDPLVGR
jgi:catechol 2,3-dioxygenase-like lactoylglutathione lyase family enzyme